MRKDRLVWIIMGVALLFTASCGNRQSDPIDLVNEYAERANTHNISIIMEMFAEDAKFELVGQGTLPNLAAIQALHEYDKGINLSLIHI